MGNARRDVRFSVNLTDTEAKDLELLGKVLRPPLSKSKVVVHAINELAAAYRDEIDRLAKILEQREKDKRSGQASLDI